MVDQCQASNCPCKVIKVEGSKTVRSGKGASWEETYAQVKLPSADDLFNQYFEARFYHFDSLRRYRMTRGLCIPIYQQEDQSSLLTKYLRRIEF